MKSLLAVAILALAATLASTPAHAQVTCYNDDSLEIINRDAAPFARYPFLRRTPQPTDCYQAPSAVITAGPNAGTVLLDGREVYHPGSNGRAIEVRTSPAGFAVIATDLGRLLVATQSGSQWSVSTWFDGNGGRAVAFSLSRTGKLLAAREDGSLIVRGDAVFNGERVTSIKASRSGRLVALLESGRLVDDRGDRLFGNYSEQAIDFKISVTGEVFYVTRDGRLGSTRARGYLFSGSSEKVVSYQVSESDDVAYATSAGRLFRNRDRLKLGTALVHSFRIWGNGRVTAVDTQGRAYEF